MYHLQRRNSIWYLYFDNTILLYNRDVSEVLKYARENYIGF